MTNTAASEDAPPCPTASRSRMWAAAGCVLAVLAGLGAELARRGRTEDRTALYRTYAHRADTLAPRAAVLTHVHEVLGELGWAQSADDAAWSLLWAHDYPYRALSAELRRLGRTQRVNHMAGIGHVSNKLELATSGAPRVPPAFRLPADRARLAAYAADRPDAMFLQKHNEHRGVRLLNTSELSAVADGDNFVQEFVSRPLLVDGYKFDIGVYVVLTSVEPLRAYWYKGDVLFRFCPLPYEPLEAAQLDRYVIADDYLPLWRVPSLRPLYEQHYNMKDSFDHYLRAQGKDPALIWDEVQAAIVSILRLKEQLIANEAKKYPHRDNMFELLRFDLLVDAALGVHLLEANMSPNLSSAHFPRNRHLYTQLLYSLFSITGVASPPALRTRSREYDSELATPARSLSVWSSECAGPACASCGPLVCELCARCRSDALSDVLRAATYEHLHRADFRRLYPPPMRREPPATVADVEVAAEAAGLSRVNRLLLLWYRGKCHADDTWCV